MTVRRGLIALQTIVTALHHCSTHFSVCVISRVKVRLLHASLRSARCSTGMQGPGFTLAFSALVLAVLTDQSASNAGVESSASNNVTAHDSPWTSRELEQQATISQLRSELAKCKRHQFTARQVVASSKHSKTWPRPGIIPCTRTSPPHHHLPPQSQC